MSCFAGFLNTRLMAVIAYVKTLFDAATPWLAWLAAGMFLAWFILLCCEARLGARELKWFRRLTFFRKSAVLIVFGFFVLIGGSKERGMPSERHFGDDFPSMRESGFVQPRSIPADMSTNALDITNFEIEQVSRTAFFGIRWATNLFDYTDSRNILVFSSTNLLERRWLPLCMIPMPVGTNAYSFTISTNSIDDNVRQSFFDTFDFAGFYRFGVDIDSDDDGLEDSFESLWTLTDPESSDTDGDGLSDGNEVDIGSNPVLADTDGDGLIDGIEYNLGTNLDGVDTDNDGLLDGEEIGRWTYGGGIPVFDVSNATNLLKSSRDYGTAVIQVALPFEVHLAGYVHTNIAVCVNGVVGLMSDRKSYPFSDKTLNFNLEAQTYNTYHTTVAAYWDNLYAPKNSEARIVVADVMTNDLRYAVIEYSNMRLYTHRTNAAEVATFQIVIPEAEPDIIYVHYINMAESFDGSSATLGIQLPSRENVYMVSFDTLGAVSNGMVIAYHLGAGSDPCVPDTDEDGVMDGDERCLGTSARYNDTDGDEMLDGWELRCGLDPLSALGNDGVRGDPDGDMLPNISEFIFDTHPLVADTDGDTLIDCTETGSLYTSNALPWLVFDEYEDVTTELAAAHRRSLSRPTPAKLWMQHELVTNVTFTAHGLVFFNRAGYVNEGLSLTSSRFDATIDSQALVVAPFLEYNYIRSDIPGYCTCIRYGTATHDGEGYILLEYSNVFRTSASNHETNAISFQVVVPTNNVDRAYVRYHNLTSSKMTGDGASVGMQTFGGQWLHSYCYKEKGRIQEGMQLVFLFGDNSNPLAADSDDDGIPDLQEHDAGTSSASVDTDGDGLPDYWEFVHGLNALSANGECGADGDFDNDGLDNEGEFELGSDPTVQDTDMDGLLDGAEPVRISFGSPVPWRTVSEITNLTAVMLSSSISGASIALPSPISIQQELITNVTVRANGLICFNRGGYSGAGINADPMNLRINVVNTNSFTIAPYWSRLFLATNAAPSEVRFGLSESDAGLCYVIEYTNLYYTLSAEGTNAISFQVSFSTGLVERVSVKYGECIGGGMDGWNASVGAQSFDARESVSYCYKETGKIRSGMALSFGVGYGTDPGQADSDGDGLLDGMEVLTWGTDPRFADTDRDGLSDCEETQLATDPLAPDTDADGMGDGWEQNYTLLGFDPNLHCATDLDPDNDIGVDVDNDQLTNGEECELGTNPGDDDSDDDGLSDAEELDIGSDPAVFDTDRDGLGDGLELTIGIDPLQPDTDGDGMNDGWEYQYFGAGFDPVVDNVSDEDPSNDLGADPDGDGMTNGQECAWNTNPSGFDTNDDGVLDGFDTDGDGVPDGVEIGQSSDPADFGDGGLPGSRALVEFTFGDPSGSHSEKYMLTVTPVAGRGNLPAEYRWLNEAYGECETKMAMLKPGWKYEVRLSHAGTSPDYNLMPRPDFDYMLSCIPSVSAPPVIIDDPRKLMPENGNDGESFTGEGKAAYLYVMDSPVLLPDYNRDGRVDDVDEAIAENGRPFRFWINDDCDDGDFGTGDSDIPGTGRNGVDGEVKGRSDLLDFTPVLLDVSRAFPPGTPARVRNRIVWRLSSDCVGAVWTGLADADAGSFHRTDKGAGFGISLSQKSYEASVTALSGGIRLPPSFLAAMESNGGKGVVMVEGRKAGAGISLSGELVGSAAAVWAGLDIRISSVEDMYRWICLRSVCGDSSGFRSRRDNPDNWPDNERNEFHFVFVHGYNVNANAARGWAAEMFKRLWQSGSNAKFTAVDWYGNESQIWEGVPVVGGETLDYYVNVRNALDTAPSLASEVNALLGNKIILAHSLGNMLVSSAAKDYQLAYTNYYMLNAAVPIESYNASVVNAEMYEHGWLDVALDRWAVNWYAHITYDNDPRRGLKWKGRFSGIRGAINCFSSTEDILDNATANGWGGLWSMQELFKGTATLYLIPGNCEGGWGYNDEHTNLTGFLTDFAKTNDFTDAELIASPVFRKFDNGILHQTNRISIAQTELNKVMGDGIPAISFAAGRNSIGDAVSENVDYAEYRANIEQWPRRGNHRGDEILLWYHSDLKNLPYFFVHKLFDRLVPKGE